MNYTKKSFTVASPGTKTYAENWERTFRPTPEEVAKLNADAAALGLPLTTADEVEALRVFTESVIDGTFEPSEKDKEAARRFVAGERVVVKR